MPTTYQLPPTPVISLLSEVMETHHQRLCDQDVRVGVLMAFAAINEDTGERKGTAIKGYAGAAAGAQVKIVGLRDRVTKKYDVEMLIDGDHWDELTLEEQTAMLDHELTHIRPTGFTDDLGRPKVKMREEDFIAWGFWEVIQRHGVAAMEHKSLKALEQKHGQLMLEGMGDDIQATTKDFHKKMQRTLGKGGSVTITGPTGDGVKITEDNVIPVGRDIPDSPE